MDEREMKRELARLERKAPASFRRLVAAYLKRGTTAFAYAIPTKPSRPGRSGAVLWCLVRAHMEAYGCGHPKAVGLLCASGKFKDEALRVIDRPEGRARHAFGPRSQTALERDYRTADQRYSNDPEFRAECDFWLPVYALAVREDIDPVGAFARVYGER